MRTDTLKPHSKYKRNGFHTTTDGFINTNKPPMGYNWALGYTEQSTMEMEARNHCKKVFMETSKVVEMRSVRQLNR